MALWSGGRVSPPVVQTIRAHNHALAVRIRTLLISHHLVPEQTPLAAVDMLVELGDRILEVAFRSPGPPDRQTIELGGIALTAFAERWTLDQAVLGRPADGHGQGRSGAIAEYIIERGT